MAKKNNEFFDALNRINDKKRPDFEPSKINGYILSLWMAQNRETIKYANKLNPYIFQLDNEIIFRYYYSIVPQSKRFIKWTKKENVSKEKQKKIDELCQKYNISPREAKLSLGE